jgi:hypothetical protein
MAIMREEETPLATVTIAMRALAQKGVARPGPGLRGLIRIRLTQMLGKLEKPGIVRRVGRWCRTGSAARSAIGWARRAAMGMTWWRRRLPTQSGTRPRRRMHGPILERRRPLMEAWAEHCGRLPGEVVALAEPRTVAG